MPQSSRYSGNAFISRRERQQVITLLNQYPDEIDNKQIYKMTVLTGVKVDENFGVILSQRGVDTADTCKLTLEMRDILSGYSDDFSENVDKWNIQIDSDLFVVGDVKGESGTITKSELLAEGFKCYKINKIIKKNNINGSVDIIEVLAS